MRRKVFIELEKYILLKLIVVYRLEQDYTKLEKERDALKKSLNDKDRECERLRKECQRLKSTTDGVDGLY